MEQKIKIKLSEFISFQIEKRQFPSHCDSDNGLKGKFMQLHMKLRGQSLLQILFWADLEMGGRGVWVKNYQSGREKLNTGLFIKDETSGTLQLTSN